jgi:RNA polymerase sigma-70 factor (ECF subfamily)
MPKADHDAGKWLAQAQAGSPEALGHALEACRSYLLLVADRELSPDLKAKGGASDLVQETFIEAQKDFACFQGKSDAEFLAWLRCLLQHRLANFARRYRKTQKRGLGREITLASGDSSSSGANNLPGDTLTPSRQAMAREQIEALERVLARLPEDYRQVIALRYQDELSFEEVGKIMQRSADAVRKLWWRALGRLRDELEAPHES